MNETQRRAVAVGFLHALQTTPDVYNEWIAIPKDDDAAIGALIQKTMSLSAAPDADDIHAMAKYIDSHLQQHVDAIKADHDDAPHHVGFVFMTQQN